MQFFGKWNEIERSFYLPEIPSGCTTLTFKEIDAYRRRSDLEIIKRHNNANIEVNIKLMNKWTGNFWSNTGYALRENEKSSIMNFQVSTSLIIITNMYITL